MTETTGVGKEQAGCYDEDNRSEEGAGRMLWRRQQEWGESRQDVLMKRTGVRKEQSGWYDVANRCVERAVRMA